MSPVVRGRTRWLQEEISVTPARPGLLQFHPPVLPHRLEQPVPGLPVLLGHQDQRLVHQRRKQVQDLAPSRSSPAPTDSAASGVKPPSNTESRLSRAGSSPESSP